MVRLVVQSPEVNRTGRVICSDVLKLRVATVEMQALTLHCSTGSLLSVLNGPLAVSRVPVVPIPQPLLHLLPCCQQRNTLS